MSDLTRTLDSWARSDDGHLHAAVLDGGRARRVVRRASARSRSAAPAATAWSAGVARIALVLAGAVADLVLSSKAPRARTPPPSGGRLRRAPACSRRGRPCRARRSPASMPWPAKRSKAPASARCSRRRRRWRRRCPMWRRNSKLFADVSDFVRRGNAEIGADAGGLAAPDREPTATGWSPMCWRPATAARPSNARQWR